MKAKWWYLAVRVRVGGGGCGGGVGGGHGGMKKGKLKLKIKCDAHLSTIIAHHKTGKTALKNWCMRKWNIVLSKLEFM